MSISRKNWSALSSLARQWTREDEEEAEREKRRRVRGSSCTADSDVDSSQTPSGGDTPTGDSTFETDSTSEMSQGLSSLEQTQVDFVELLRVRDEKRRMRHVATLRRQKESEEEDLDEDQGGVLPPKPQPSLKTAPCSPTNNSNVSSNVTDIRRENGESSGKDPEVKPSSNPTRKFVSSLSISLDQSPSASECRTPTSTCSPTGSVSPREHWPSPCQSPSPRGAQSPVQNGPTKENDISSNGNFERTAQPAFVRHSPRTISFRTIRKKEEEHLPLQRSASVRMASKKFESNTDQNEGEDKTASFQRNSRQRVSSRSIQEKMERLAQAAQKSEMMRSPDVTQRTLFLPDEVSRKRGLFEKEQQAACPTSPGVPRREFKSFTSGMSDRINRWLNKTKQSGSSQSPVDLRHVDITVKRSVFERDGEGTVSKTSSGKIHK